MRYFGLLSILFSTVVCADEGLLDAEREFERSVRPVLVTVCFRCHGGERTAGGLRVDSREALLKGGESGPAIVEGNVEESLLIKAIRRSDETSAMPPDRALEPRAVAAFEAWIAAGAVWPEAGVEFRSDQHWAFAPVRRNSLPHIRISPAGNPAEANRDSAQSLTGGEYDQQLPALSKVIDQFLNDQLAQEGLQPLSEADLRTLVRRASYDLTGLPPDPMFMDRARIIHPADESHDRREHSAFLDRYIDELLQSTHYGETWGRHWLDIVRYADTAGENSDHPLPHAWKYRNWVIDAINADKPYDQFVREQLAGDFYARRMVDGLSPEEQQSEAVKNSYEQLIVATGYLAIARRFGHDIDKDMHLTHEDVIDTLGKSFLGLTLGCARCHTHKYDPISADDYYALYGIFDSTRFSFPGCEPQQQPRDLVSTLPPAAEMQRHTDFQLPIEKLDQAISELETRLSGQSIAADALAAGRSLIAEGAVADGGSTELTATQIEALNNIDVQAGDMIVLSIYPHGNYGADSTLIELQISNPGDTQQSWHLNDVLDHFLSSNPVSLPLKKDADTAPSATWAFLDARNGLQLLPERVVALNEKSGLQAWRKGDNPAVFVNSTAEPVSVWTTLPARTVFVHPAIDGPVAIGWISPIAGRVQVSGKVADAHPGVDGVDWKLERISSDITDRIVLQAEILADIEEQKRLREEARKSVPPAAVAYAVWDGRVHDAPRHERGDPEKPGPEIQRRWLSMFGGEPLGSSDYSGRLQLAEKITSPENPLFARVMVNRIWQYHFGNGIVRTPNDFGTRGQAPSHPELLDWLAEEFQRSGYSLKHMHRIIMKTAAWRRSSFPMVDSEIGVATAASEKDASNALLWKFTQRRLSAEEIRDSLLAACGRLDLTKGAAHPFPPESSWGFTQHTPFNATYDTNRRSVYLMAQRNRRHPFLGLFDGADPNASTAQRQSTIVPPQALYFMNDPFVFECAGALAEELLKDDDDSIRTEKMYLRCLQRLPTDSEFKQTQQYCTDYSKLLLDVPESDREREVWVSRCRLMLSSNEFLFVD